MVGAPVQVASTRVCAATGSIGLPVGTQVDEPANVASGAPPASTRVAPVSHWPVTHGGLDDPVSAQPAIAYGLAMVTTGWPLDVTRGNGVTGGARPAWGH